ncbi:MAG TPA: glycosyltransferase family 4 protein, partial [Acidimicrobiales bacterium]|nr:glycosyltransferase family 4 protein [Acidimicrobiales bacterium]
MRQGLGAPCSTWFPLPGQVAVSPELLFLGHGAERSGPPIFLANLQRWLARRTDVDLATVLARGGALVEDYRACGAVRVLDTPAAPARVTARLPGLQRVVDRVGLHGWDRPTAVYVNTVAPATLRLLERVDRSATVIVHVHEMEAALRYGVDPGGTRQLFRRADHVVAASRAVADNLVTNHDVDSARIHVHHEFVEPVEPVHGERRRDERRRLGVPEDAFVVGGSGMLEWRKAPELFVRLAADLRGRTDRGLAFVWVGGTDRGPLWAPLDHDARHLGVEDVVRFVGAQDRPGDWFRVLDVFALTSREDAFPLAALEAASAGVPVVTFDTGGMVELVGDGSCGAVVPYPDTAAFADVLAALAGDAAARRSLGAAAA